MGGGSVGGGTIGMCERRRAGTTLGVKASACCSSCPAPFSLSVHWDSPDVWLFWFNVRGVRQAGDGTNIQDRPDGFTNTLAMKIPAMAVMITASASQVRRTRRQRRPAGS